MQLTPRVIALVAGLTTLSSTLGAQSLSLGLRGSGSIPTGAFSQDQAAANSAVIEGAKSGFGYGLDVGLGLGPIGVYAGFDHVKFDCQTTSCRTDGKYTLQGVTAGVKLMAPSVSLVHPFVRGGVTFNDLQGGYGGQSSNVLTTDKTPGYEIGVGADVSFLGIVSITPQARYIGQNLKAKIPGVTAPAATGDAVNYFSFDLGLSVHTPFGK
jgi:hypothetical protein